MSFFHRRPDLRESMKDEEKLGHNAEEIGKEIDSHYDRFKKIKDYESSIMRDIAQLRRAIISESDPVKRKALLTQKDGLEAKIKIYMEQGLKDLKIMLHDTKKVNSLLLKEKKIDDDLLDDAA